jgi:alpha-beta hydrolase superfamily lysophospholipase
MGGRLRVVAVLVVAGLLVAACSDDDDDDAADAPVTTSDVATATEPTAVDPDPDAAGTTTTTAVVAASAGAAAHAVGVIEETFVDAGRPTPRSGDVPERPDRTLPTTVFYPALGEPGGEAAAGAAADVDGGPYPLLVFAHGLGATPGAYADLLTGWAAAGYVVAAPEFPLSSASAPAGPDGADVANQPGDLSFLIDEVLGASAAGDGPLGGAVDPDAIAVAGHSNGAITTLGIAANTCCRDDRLDAAIVLAGLAAEYAAGDYDLADTPAVLFVHGTADALLPYAEAVRVAEDLTAPRAMLTLEGGDHSSWVNAGDPAFDAVLRTSTDFLDAYVRGDADAQARLRDDGEPGVATMYFADDPGVELAIPTSAPVATDRQASVSDDTDLVDGQVVTVSWSGYTPGQVVNIVQCAHGGEGSADACELTTGRILEPNPTGSGSVELEIVVGPVGDGACGVGEPPCVIVVNDGGLQDPDATIRIPISFAA